MKPGQHIHLPAPHDDYGFPAYVIAFPESITSPRVSVLVQVRRTGPEFGPGAGPVGLRFGSAA